MMKLEMIACPKCGNDFPLKRKELGYHVCVNCSTAKPVVAFRTSNGEGDHTYNDIVIMDQDRAKAIVEAEAQYTGERVNIEVLDFDKDTVAVSQSISDTINTQLGEDYI
jgi:hypothetical protein